MIRRLYTFLLLLMLLPATQAMAATDVITIDYLPLQEAAMAARSQLSPDGSVGILASRRMLLVDDDEAHLKKVRALLKRLDVRSQQYTLHLTIEDVLSNRNSQAQMSGSANLGNLPGGWVQLRLQDQRNRSMNSQQYSLRLSAGQPASMEIGTLEPIEETRVWLSSYGLMQVNSVTMTPITSGFHVTARPAGADQVHLRITPWMQRQQDVQLQGQQEMLLGLGNSSAPATPPGQTANMRLNARPVIKAGRRINISGAATEVTVHKGEEVEIAASHGEANRLGEALLSRYSGTGQRQFVIRLKIDTE
ncbi:hypothetical protein [Mariprofundus ferrooxydans]|uniref:Type II and III secretion system family protein n=1 Tax=Mariprofundus ferrooxydans PV-1 TaxID=314345 RepID=Q0F1H0_9PROT|nr:hypothetical protein [Mariprofundus ferrooxydans]EAU55221.1 type II and III secretion system family protein [Mariprofundus ferrooxydans PV-1]KON47601.1 type II and III secretion system family protein [Mariprofundus ferrooxydans]